MKNMMNGKKKWLEAALGFIILCSLILINSVTAYGAKFVAASGGGGHVVAVKSDGTVWTWGYNSDGQLGDGTTVERHIPVQVKGPGEVGYLTNVIAVVADSYNSFALKSDGTVWGWGYNANGQLGDGTTTDRLTPVQVKGPEPDR